MNENMRSEYNKTILPNGLTIVTEKIPFVRSVSVGVWVKTGSRVETKEENGITHFLEHMLFKGTEKRSARDIARSLESVGGYLNAFTAKEYTCFYAEVLDEFSQKALDVLGDILSNSLFDAKEFKKEREVILDEIDSVEDTPDDLIQEYFVEKLYPNNSLGLPILGSKKSVSGITLRQLKDFYRKNCSSGNTIIAATGNLEHTRIVEWSRCYFHLSTEAPRTSEQSPQQIGRGEFKIKRTVNQAHICLGTAGLPYAHHRKYELLLFNTLLGVGMGSRLFQNIREQHGVAYSIYSFLDFFRDNGLLAIYLGTEKNKTDKALKLLDKELLKLKNQSITPEELDQVKAQLKGNILLSLESASRRMSRLAKMEIYLQQFQGIERVIDEINHVSLDHISNLVSHLLEADRMLKVMFIPN